jgi:hypothetical protein
MERKLARVEAARAQPTDATAWQKVLVARRFQG